MRAEGKEKLESMELEKNSKIEQAERKFSEKLTEETSRNEIKLEGVEREKEETIAALQTETD
jgi:hypothetical protein